MPEEIKQDAEPTVALKPTIQPPSITPQSVKPVPENIAKMEFKIDPEVLKNTNPDRVIVEDQSGATKPAKMVETPSPEKKVEEPEKKVEEKKEKPEKKEEKKEEKPSILKPPSKEKKEETAKEKKEEVVKQVTLPSKDKIVRDYSGYSEEEIAHLKQMSDTAYKYVTELIKKNKETAKVKDQTFLQHPNAYMLSPEFKSLQEDSIFARKEADFWRDALIRVKKGEDIKPITGWDEDGNPVLGDPVKASDMVEETVRSNMNRCLGVATSLGEKIKGFGSRFQDQVKQDLTAINKERAARFQWVANPELLDYTLPINGVGDMSVRQIREHIIGLFPDYYRNNPGVEVAADLFVALRIQDAELEELRKEKTVSDIKVQEAKRGEPSSDVRPAESKPVVGKVKEFSLSGLPS